MIFKVTELPARLLAVPVETLPQFPDQYFLVVADRYFKHFTVILKILKNSSYAPPQKTAQSAPELL